MLSRADVAALVAALAPRVEGGQVQKIREPDPHTVVLRVRRPGQTTRLLLSCHPLAPRIAAAPASVPTAPEPGSLGAWLRAAAGGRRLTRLEHLAADRVVIVHFADGARLVAELTPTPNLFGLDPAGRIAAVARRPMARGRDLRPGRIWTPPEGGAPLGALTHTDPEAVERAAAARLCGLEADEDAVARRRLAQRTRRRLRRLREKVAQDVARTLDADGWQRSGTLLTAQLHEIRRGDTEAAVQDWYAEGAPIVRIPLDPALDGPANAARYFDRAKKARAGAERAAERLAEVEAALATLARLEAEAPTAAAFEEALRAAGLFRDRARGGRRAAEGPRLPFREYRSAAGELIRVGRGGADNHATTFRHARGNDHWLHVRDAAGAHVIVPEPSRGQAPHPETLRDAAALAVHHSRLRGEANAAVSHTQRKHVRAVKGAGPGRVTVADARAITVADLEARLARLEPRRT